MDFRFRQSNCGHSTMSQSEISEIFKTLDEAFEDSMLAAETTKENAKYIARQVKKEAGDLEKLFKGPVRRSCIHLYVFRP